MASSHLASSHLASNDYDGLLASLTAYVAQDVLEGDADELGPDTPLLELGVLNSLEVARLLAFIERTHGVRVPGEVVRIENLVNLAAIATMVAGLQASREG